MSNQQLFLVVLASTLCIAAVPGLIMTPPQPEKTKESEVTEVNTQSTGSDGQRESMSQKMDVTSDVPNTRLNLTETTKEKREQIRFSRKININEASFEELQNIPKVGPATAQSIVDYREKGNVFYRVEDMEKIKGIGSRTIDSLRPHITVGKKYMNRQSPSGSGSSSTPKININRASKSELESLTGIGPSYAQRIIDYRESEGRFLSVDDLGNVKGIGPATVDKIRDSVTTR